MKKIGIVLAVFLVMLSLITISYASFIIDGNGNIIVSTNQTKINVANVKVQDYVFINSDKTTGLSYYLNSDGTKQLINDEAQIKIDMTIDHNIYDMYVSYFSEFDFYFKLDVSNSSFLQNLNPLAYISTSNNKPIYFTMTYLNASTTDRYYEGRMPISLKSIFSIDYFDYIAANGTKFSIVIDFTKALANQTIYLDGNDTMSLEIGIKEAI